jgi:hypothetical protein
MVNVRECFVENRIFIRNFYGDMIKVTRQEAEEICKELADLIGDLPKPGDMKKLSRRIDSELDDIVSAVDTIRGHIGDYEYSV